MSTSSTPPATCNPLQGDAERVEQPVAEHGCSVEPLGMVRRSHTAPPRSRLFMATRTGVAAALFPSRTDGVGPRYLLYRIVF
ncbi:hypothetical protein [Nonomuraea sp. NPDC049684]|uniref:hypothetical protein n=1 Tax=Nonomuraea sp. NPDC049684 TaxID=3364356 RepID=UPI0037BC677D